MRPTHLTVASQAIRPLEDHDPEAHQAPCAGRRSEGSRCCNREIEAGDAILKEIETLKSEAKRLQALAEKKKDRLRHTQTVRPNLTGRSELRRMFGDLPHSRA
jgi:hypothetical protein